MREQQILFDSFNARYLDFSQIADLFIPNIQYNELIKNNHSLLMGPRGSGKTTLLKMLTVPAQCLWNLKNSETEVKYNLPFFAIYIPTDVHWKKQIDEFENEFKSYKQYQSTITRLLVTTNIMISLCDTFINIIEFKEKSSSDLLNEALLVDRLIEDWKISKPISKNLISIRHAFLQRLNEINIHVKKVKLNSPLEKDIIYPEYFLDDYLNLIQLGCDSFETIFKSDPYFEGLIFKWALCFDELEIAPKWLQIELLSILRSLNNQKIIFKLTMVPLVLLDERSEMNGIEMQDFNVIRTWSYSRDSKKEWETFSRKLIQDKLRRRFSQKINPLTILGSSDLDQNIIATFSHQEDFMEKTGYAKGSYNWILFKELAWTDPTFKEFLELKKIDPINPIPIDNFQKDSIFRKTKPIALFRYQYINSTGKIRGRKNASLYYGIPNIYNICDGNPRALIGLIDEIISKLKFSNRNVIERIDIKLQSSIISDLSARYLKILKNHPDSNILLISKYLNLGELLERIGKYFENKFIKDAFKMDPINCFIVDKSVPQEVTELLKVAMHLGAIIYMDPDESISKDGLLGKKFRLSYLLFPNFKQPLIEYNEINLSRILNTESGAIDQLLLFETR